jgi:hypothetical protein
MTIDFMLPALSDVAGDVTVTLDILNANARGLDGLRELRGNLIVRSVEAGALDFLARLEHVHGNVDLQLNSVTSLLPSLHTVDRDLVIRPYRAGREPRLFSELVLPRIREVRGGVRLDSVRLEPGGGPPINVLPMLANVTGGLEFVRGGNPWRGTFGATTLNARSLTLETTEFTAIPLARSVRIREAIRIVNNSMLCTMAVTDFVTAQGRASGDPLVTVSGNGGC